MFFTYITRLMAQQIWLTKWGPAGGKLWLVIGDVPDNEDKWPCPADPDMLRCGLEDPSGDCP